MKIIPSLTAMMLLTAGLLTGCQSPQVASTSNGIASQSLRNNGYSLLHQLLNEQKNVSLLRFIRPEHADVKQLVNKIATTSGTGAKLLEAFSKDDPTISLDDIGLPPGELATRAAIAATKQKELLSQSGDTFELTLLLTQTEALSYGWHLAEVTAQNEPQPERARALAGLGRDMQNLYQEVFALLLSRIDSPATNSNKLNATSTFTNHVPAGRMLMIDPSSMPVGGDKATLIIGALQRVDGVYTGDYKIKVFPYFLKNETGRLTIIVSDDSLAVMNQGKAVAIIGTATTNGKGGKSRHIDAKATPTDINGGMLKLWFMAGNRKTTFAPAYHFAQNTAAADLAQTTETRH
jgi:hypothetical protein